MAPHAVFRFEASPSIGSGHGVRSLALAQWLSDAGWRVSVAASCETVETMALPAPMRHIVLAERWPDEVARIGSEVGSADLLVVDHYGRDARFETTCRAWARRILVIDDLADRPHDCDVLLDQTLGRREGDYRALVPARCRLLLGPRFALLRPEFAALRPASLARRQAPCLQRILVSMGGTDPHDVAATAVRGILQSGLSVEVNVALGAAAPSPALVSIAGKIGGRVRMLPRVGNMAELMAEADLAIGAGGVTSWERCCTGLPTLVVVTADNQETVAARLAEAGAVQVLGRYHEVGSKEVGSAVRRMGNNPIELYEMSRFARDICDGRGVIRTILALGEVTETMDSGVVRWRAAERSDEALFLEWQRHPLIRRFSRNPAIPSAEEHREWLGRKIADPACLMTVIEFNGEAAGTLRLDRDDANGWYEISILTSPAFQRRGIAMAALSLARCLLPAAQLVAQVLPSNDSSHRLFRKAGFRPLENGWYMASGTRDSAGAAEA